MASGAGPGELVGLTAEQETAWFAYMRVVLRLGYELNHQLQQDHDLSLADYDVLNALADSPDSRLQITALGVRLGWERSRVSHRLRRMEGRGLVRRERSSTDARATDAALTAAGTAAVEAATPSHAALVKRLFFDGLPEQTLPHLTEAMEAIHEQLLLEGTLARPASRQTRWA